MNNRSMASASGSRATGVADTIMGPLEFLTRIPVTLLVSVATLWVATLAGSPDWLQFDTRTLEFGNVWTLLTCHLVHFNSEHLFWDLLVFAGIGGALEMKNRGLLLATLGLSALLIPILSVAGPATVTSYRGLSGIDTGLFAALATHQLIFMIREKNRSESLICGLLLAAMIGKSLFELITGATIFVSSSQFVPLPVAHLSGALTGAALAGLWCAVSTPLRARP